MAFHFMSTNKWTKKPFWREKWERGAGEKKAPLKPGRDKEGGGWGGGGGAGRHADRAENPK